MTIGDTNYNFDGVQNIVPPPGGQVTLISPDDNVSGGERSDLITLEITGFAPGEVMLFHTDVDRDDSDTTEDFRSILFNNGALANASATVSSPQQGQSATVIFMDEDLRSSYSLSTLPGDPSEPGTSPQHPKTDPGNLTTERGNDGKVIYMVVVGTASGGGVWGTDVYTDDSDLSTAAVHAGVVADGEAKIVKVTVLPGSPSYEGTTRNGVISSNYGSWSGSYKVEAVGGGTGSGDLAIVLELVDNTNTPTLKVTNTSTGTLQLTAFELTIGDTAFNFDAVTDVVAPVGTGVTLVVPDNNDDGVRTDLIRLTFTGFDPGETVTFIADVDRDDSNTIEDYRRVLFNNGDAPNALATAFAGAASCSITLPDAADESSYRLECGDGGTGSGELGFTFDILNSANTPTFRVINTSAGMLQLTGFEVTIGDTAFNFDTVTEIVAPPGTEVTVETPDVEEGVVRSDLVRFTFSGFDPGESVTFVVDVDRDDDNTVEDYRRVMFNNGDAPNAKATAFAGAESYSITLPDAADTSFYRFECGSVRPGIGVGLVAYYPLDGNALDPTGNGHDGTLFGATPTVDRDGNADSAVAFNGVDNYIGVPYSADMQPSVLTLALWAQRDSWDVASFSDNAALAGNADSGGYEFFIDRGAGELQGYVRSKSGSYAHPGISLAELAPGWHHFALTCDGVNTILYVDGVPVAVDSTGDGIVHYTRNNSFIIGAEASAGSDPEGDNFAGRIDDVRLYGRVLYPEEIQELAGIGGIISLPLRITLITRDRATHAVTLNWEPAVDIATIEHSVNLTSWETLVDSVSGTTWTGPIPGDPKETYLRVHGTVTGQ